MSGKTSKMALTALTIILTILAGYYRNFLNCGEQPVALWIVGCLFLLSVACLLNNSILLTESYPRIAYGLIFGLTPLAVVAVIIWSLLGSMWIIQNLLFGNKCLPLLLSICILWVMMITHIAVIISLLAAVAMGFKILLHKGDENSVKKKLLEVYNNIDKINPDKIIELLCKYRDVIDTMTLLKEEKTIIKTQFSTNIHQPVYDSECIICLIEFKKNDMLTSFDCSHNYHFDCITEWLTVKPDCPCCRRSFRPSLLKKRQVKMNTV